MIKKLIGWLYEWKFKEELDGQDREFLMLVNENFALKQHDHVEELNQNLLCRYPSKLITYLGRVVPTTKKRINVPVSVLITPTDKVIINDLKSWGLYKPNQNVETLIPKIYKAYMQKHYQYRFDKDNWDGLNELWEFPFELYGKYGKGKWPADCDSHAIALVSYMRAAGIPAGFVWVVVGDCKLGGHATFYAFGTDGKFHHLNSTSRHYKPNVSDYPTHQDARDNKDNMGITNVWLSFNDLVARSEFDKKKIGDIIINK